MKKTLIVWLLVVLVSMVACSNGSDGNSADESLKSVSTVSVGSEATTEKKAIEINCEIPEEYVVVGTWLDGRAIISTLAHDYFLLDEEAGKAYPISLPHDWNLTDETIQFTIDNGNFYLMRSSTEPLELGRPLYDGFLIYKEHLERNEELYLRGRKHSMLSGRNVYILYINESADNLVLDSSFDFDDIIIAEDNTSFAMLNGALYNTQEKELVYANLSWSEYYGSDMNFTIPEGIEKIGPHAFHGSKINVLTLPASLKEIDPDAFADLSVDEIRVQEDNPYFVMDGGVLYNQDKSELIKSPSGWRVEIPETVKEIYGGALTFCTVEEIPDSVVKIYSNAFEFAEIYGDLPSNLVYLGKGAFASATWEDDNILVIPKTLSVIPERAFYNDPSLSTAEFYYSFYGPEALPYYTDEIRENGGEDAPLKIMLHDGIKAIHRDAFTSAFIVSNLPAELEFIGTNAFECAVFSGNVTIPEKIEAIPDSAFRLAYGLESIEFESTNLKKIEGEAFSLADVVDVIIPDSVSEVGAFAFFYCPVLENLHLPESLEVLNNIISDCNALKTINIPDSVTSIDESTFAFISGPFQISISESSPVYDFVQEKYADRIVPSWI